MEIEYMDDRPEKKKKKYVDPQRGQRVREEMVRSAKEGDVGKKKAGQRVGERVNKILEKDESADCRGIKAYFEWLRLGLLGDSEADWEILMKESDLEQKFIRSQGAGGQNVNKVSSAVQLKHRPSGVFVKVQESRDQSQNRERARVRLKEKILEHLADWTKVIGDGDENVAMMEVFKGVLSKKEEVKGVRGESLLKIGENLREKRDI